MALGVRPIIEERVEQRMRESEAQRGREPTITVEATGEGIRAKGDTPKTIPLIPYHLIQMTRIEAMDLAQW